VTSHSPQKYRVALVGNPNSGKSAVFNALTGLRQTVANYPGATVERRAGLMKGADHIEIIDLPGSYSLAAKSPDEQVTRDILMGEFEAEARPDLLVYVVDATNLTQHLTFLIELKSLGLPIILSLNMLDLAKRDQIEIDTERLAQEVCVPVAETIAVRKAGMADLRTQLLAAAEHEPVSNCPAMPTELRARQKKARQISSKVILSEGIEHRATRLLDRYLLHPISGPFFLFAMFFVMFQAVFSWAEAPMGWIDAGIAEAQAQFSNMLGDGMLLSLLNDGILSGVGAVLVFLPQILILFAFILMMETTGYMARAAFIMDRLMGAVGLNGRSFIPLLSSFACAIPGIMSARTIADPKDRITTIMVAPLITCSARLPVYVMLIAAFIPNEPAIWGLVGLQGLVMFCLYMAGILAALLVAFVMKRTVTKGAPLPFIMELPKYQLPNRAYIITGLWTRTKIFCRRAGTVIFTATVILWVLATFPGAPDGATNPIEHSFAGIIGAWLAVIFAPIGFNWAISIALIPGMAAREVAIAALGTVYAIAATDENSEVLQQFIQTEWSLATGLSFLVWFIFAPQCLSTIAVTRRETGGWKWPLAMLVYLFVLAYGASFITYHGTLALM